MARILWLPILFLFYQKKQKKQEMIYGLRREKLGFATEVQTAFSIYSIFTVSNCSYIVKIVTYRL
jgi:hypothetical protein